MRRTRFLARIGVAGLGAAVAGLAATSGAGSAAATNGIGSGTVSTSAVNATLGDLLGLTLLEDVASSTTDAKRGTVGATSRFRQVTLTSSLTDAVPSLNRVIGEHTVSAPGGTPDTTTSALDLTSSGLGPVVNGTVAPLVLHAAPAPSAATASTAKITEVGLLGGLASLGTLDATDRTASAGTGSEVGRGMTLDTISLLDLGKLLQGLGLDAFNLPLPVVSGLVTSLGVPVDLQGASDVASLVNSINAALTALQNTLDATITPALLGVLGSTGLPAALLPPANQASDAAVSNLQATLTTLIASVIDQLDATTLLKVSSLEIDTVAKAADTMAGSVATATGSIGGLMVGKTVLPGIDLAASGSAVDSLVAQVQAALGAAVAPLGFTDLLSVKLFDRQTGVTSSNGVVKAVSSITGLDVGLTPPSLDSLVLLDHPDDGFGSLIPVPTVTSRHGAARVAPAGPNPLEQVLARGLNEAPLLSKGLDLRIGTVASQSLQSVPAAAPAAPQSPVTPQSEAPATPTAPTATPTTPATGELPRTGGEQSRLALVGMVLFASALGVRRLRRAVRS